MRQRGVAAPQRLRVQLRSGGRGVAGHGVRDADSDRARSASRRAGRRPEAAAARGSVGSLQASGVRCVAVRAANRLRDGAAAAVRAVPNAPRAVGVQQPQILRRPLGGRDRRGQSPAHQVLLPQHEGSAAVLEREGP